MSWKPVKDEYTGEYRIIGIPSGNSVGLRFWNIPKMNRSVDVWLTTQEAEDFGQELLEKVYRNKRIQGIRNADFIFRWQ